MAITPDGGGYWLVASDGGVFSYGDANFYGSMGGKHLNDPIVGMATDTGTGGYWLVASDGGVFAFNAPYYGSMGGKHLNQPIVGVAARPGGNGYWFVASDGGIFAFNAPFYGSMGGQHLNQPIVGMTPTPNGNGYWFVASDGGIFATTLSSTARWGTDRSLPRSSHGLDHRRRGLLGGRDDGGIFALGDAQYFGSLGARATPASPASPPTPHRSADRRDTSVTRWTSSAISSTTRLQLLGSALPRWPSCSTLRRTVISTRSA